LRELSNPVQRRAGKLPPIFDRADAVQVTCYPVCPRQQSIIASDYSSGRRWWYDHYAAKLRECEAQIERQCAAMRPRVERDQPPPTWPLIKPGSTLKNQPAYNERGHLLRLTGVALVTVTGLSASMAQTNPYEVGTDMSRFPTVKHFCSWLGLAPHHDIWDDRVWRSRTLKVVNRATQAFRQAAQSVARSHSAFETYFRSMRARLGPEQETVATAHKIARVVYQPAEVSRNVAREVSQEMRLGAA
jgi:transposase